MPDWDVAPISARQLPPLAVQGAVLSGKYQLEGLIGHGGMGSVWAAKHLGLDQKVAVKIVSPQYAKLPDIRRRFDVEAKAAARLRSRHVVQVFDNGELEDGTPFMVMEFLEGEGLSQRLQHGGPVPLNECVRVMSHVCRALGMAHEQGIVHRDIKPENIYLARTNDEDAFVAKVLDFGIAKVSTASDQSSTRTGELMGTPMFMSPEQARGLRSIDFRTDLFSLGLVAYSMLTGAIPFKGESYGELIVQICTQPLPSVRAVAPWVPPAVEAWFQQACAREPEARFQGAQQMAEAFSVACSAAVPVIAPLVQSWPAPPPGPSGYPASHGTAVPVSRTHGPGTAKLPIAAMVAIGMGGLALGSFGIGLAVHLTRGSVAAATAPTDPSAIAAVSAPPALSLAPLPAAEAIASASASAPAASVPPKWGPTPWKPPSPAPPSPRPPGPAPTPNMGF